MKYGAIDGLDKPVSKLVLGADWFEEAEEGRALAVLDAFAEAGGNCIDMAHVYSGGQGQRIVGRWLRANDNRDEIVLLDKGCHPYDGRQRMTPEDLDSDLRDNLDRLQVDSIDLFVLHRDDPETHFRPVMERLNELAVEGQISAFGASNWTHLRLADANAWSESKGLRGFSLNNPNLSLAAVNEPRWDGCVTIDRQGLDWHRQTQFPLFAWASQGGGFFAGVRSPDIDRVYANEENVARKLRAESLAQANDVSLLNIALAYVLCQPFPTWALIGPRSVEELESSLPALDVELTQEGLRWLETGA
jgi:1-deoxyxylulose-5-phosphate synthase